MLAFASYEKLPDKERYVGGGRFGYVEKVRRKPDAKVRRIIVTTVLRVY